MDLKYLNLLSREYPTIQAVTTEIVNLNAISRLPKGTEHFMSDLHGEHEAFLHIMNTCSGVIREKIDVALSNTITIVEKNELAELIYYPERSMEKRRFACSDMGDWYSVVITRMVLVCHAITHKYTRSKVRKALPADFAYIIDELLNANSRDMDMTSYYESIIHSIVRLDSAEAFIIALANLIKRMAIDHLHIVGDIFDRGPHADVILDRLMRQHSVDIEWGNHDVLWMGAASGSLVCIATVIKNCIQYDNLDMLENSYGISLLPLAVFAAEHYGNAEVFMPRVESRRGYRPRDPETYARMHKAVSVIMFKLEGQIIDRNPQFNMSDRNLLKRINYDTGEIDIGGRLYRLNDSDFPTIDKNNPCALTKDEEILIKQIRTAFLNSEKLQTHIKYLYSVGSLYKVYNNNLLYHGCVPLNEDGSFMEFEYEGKTLCGKSLFDYADQIARQAYYIPEAKFARDFLWFLWCGRNSPLFGRDKITTFERLLIADKGTWIEKKNAYYENSGRVEVCEHILREFGIEDTFSHIINGHIPVRAKEGESPQRASGKLIVIDGGFCKAYRETTGIAGYTMFFSSHGLHIAAHEPFDTLLADNDIINADARPQSSIVDNAPHRISVAETDTGKEFAERIDVLEQLLEAYKLGLIKENKKPRVYSQP